MEVKSPDSNGLVIFRIRIYMSKEFIRIGAKYKHFKGNVYLVIHIAKNTETMEDMVVYQALYGNKEIWVRSLSMFLDYVNIEGKLMRRFKEIK